MEGSKLQHKQKISNQTNFFIDQLLHLFAVTNNQKYLRHAFLYSVRLKNSFLRQQLMDIELVKSLGTNNPLTIKQQALKRRLNFIKRMIRENRLSSEDAQSEMFEIREDIDKISDTLRLGQPELYANLSKTFDLNSVETILVKLKNKNASLLNFSQSDSTLIVFHLTDEKFDVSRIILSDSLRSRIDRMDRLSLHENTLTQRSASNVSSDLHQTFATILQPVLSQLPLKETVFVLSDGWFNQIPLELLAKSDCGNCQSYHDIDYLLRHHTFNYLVSPDDLLLDKKANESKRISFFAPSYGDQSTLRSLQYTDSELDGLNKIGSATQFTGEQVDADFFKEKASDFRVIHLSTHATADVLEPANSVIYFSPSDSSLGQATKLYPSDFSDLSLDADMVVLSACETGKGKQYSGEGVYSFSRYFLSSGARSVIHNLWKADDLSTSSILSSFYTNLSSGKNKAQSLRKAKLEYLSNTDERGAHPYYWSTLVVIGNPDPIVGMNFEIITILLIGAVFLGLAIFFLRKRNQAK